MTDYPRCARPGQGGHEWERLERDMERLFGKFRQPMRPDDEAIPGRDDLDPRDFIRPDGSYDVTAMNLPDESMHAHIEQWRANKGAIR